MLRIFRKIWPILLVIFFIILIQLPVFNFLKQFLGQTLSCFRPLYFSFSKVSNYLTSRNNLLLANEKLNEEIQKLKIEISQLKIVEEENEDLREHLNFSRSVSYRIKQANVIGKRVDANSIFYLIDQGEGGGLIKGMAVIQANGYLVGKIFKVEKNHSLFLPLKSNYFSAAVDIISRQGRENKIKNLTSGIASGKYGLLIEVNFVPAEREIKPGDFVITSGLEELVPRGLLLGEVVEIEKRVNQSFQRLVINAPIEPNELRVVGIAMP